MTNRNFKSLLLLFVFIFCLFTACGGGEAVTPTPTPTAATPALSPTPGPTPDPVTALLSTLTVEQKPVTALLSTLTVEQKVGQLLVGGFEGTSAGADAVRAIQEYQVGGVILYERNVESLGQLAGLTNTLKDLNGGHIPLFITTDEEGGAVTRMPPEITDIPAARTFGSIGDAEQRLNACYTLGGTLARLCAAVGISMNYAPVLDVWSNQENTVIGSRAFSSDPLTAAYAAAEAAYGMMDAGVIPTAKHFPGHGDTTVDSHAGLPVVDKSLEELERLELVPFREAIRPERFLGAYEEGRGAVPAVMVGHILLTALDGQRPASLSPAVVTGLLREDMGFDGLICTDDLTMGAVSDTYSLEEAAVLAVEAGCDMLLVCHGADNLTTARDALLSAVESGRISRERLDESVRRVLSLKLEYGVTNDPVPIPDAGALNQTVADLLALVP